MTDIARQQAIVKLNVGGVPYQTSFGTLTRYPGSLIAEMAANWNPDSQQPLFIDFDGDLFKPILEYLRFGDSVALEEDKCLQRLLNAAEFLKLPGLKAVIQKLQAADGVGGLSGVHLHDGSPAVKLTRHGVSTVVDSFIGYRRGFIDDSPRVLGLIVSGEPISRLNESGHAVACAGCTQKIDIAEAETLARLREAAKTSRTTWADQLALLRFIVSGESYNNCVRICPCEGFGGGGFHIAKSFLCFA